MSEASYEFDPCSIDGSHIEEVTLDNWKPRENLPKISPSQWRQRQIGNDFNQQPGLDDLHKIHKYLNKKLSDSEIMNAFGLTAETLIAIKAGNYDPVEGISLDNQSKIYKEFRKIEEKMESFLRALNYIADIMFIDKKEKAEFKKSFLNAEKNLKSRKMTNMMNVRKFVSKMTNIVRKKSKL
jgi:hypothetical protein